MQQRITLVMVAVIAALFGIAVAFTSLSLVRDSYALPVDKYNGVIDIESLPQSAALPKISRTFLNASTGITPSYSQMTATQVAFPNDGYTWLEISSTVASAQVITIETPGTINGLPIGDLSVTVPTSTRVMVGPFVGSLFNRKSGDDKGYIYVTLPSTSNVRVASFSVGGN